MSSVPAVGRAAAILEFLSREPQQTFTLSEVTAAVGIHKASCHSLLGELTADGLVTRIDLRYALGPALISYGYAALRRFDAYLPARAEIFAIAESLNVSCLVSARDGATIVILDMAGDIQPAHLPSRRGRRYPLEPPLGLLFYAWEPDDVIEHWLTTMQSDQPEVPRNDVLAALMTIRSRGYSLSIEGDFDIDLQRVLRLAKEEDRDQMARELGDLMRSRFVRSTTHHADDRPLNYIIAPIFSSTSQVCASLTMFASPGQLTTSVASEYAGPLLMAARRVTQAIGGVDPLVRSAAASAFP